MQRTGAAPRASSDTRNDPAGIVVLRPDDSPIGKAINYVPERTQTALERIEEDGQVLRNDSQ
jgi:hypothetical protein